MKDEENYVYRIWDVDNNRYWSEPCGKRQWSTADFALSAWDSARNYGSNKPWRQQEDTERGYILHTFRLQRVTS